MAYLGLVPSESSGGGKRRQGSLTRTGTGICAFIWAIACEVGGKRHANKATVLVGVAPKVSSPLVQLRESGYVRLARGPSRRGACWSGLPDHPCKIHFQANAQR